MKFAIATIFTLALAMSIECSVIGLGHHHEIAGHGLAYTAVSGPAHAHVLGHVPHASIAVHAAAPWAHVAAPWHGVTHDIAHGAWHGDLHGHHSAVVVDHGHHAVHAVHGVVDHGHHAVHAIHGAHVVVAPHHEGSYVAKTRGAVHTAPLAGHISSAAAINVAPAPGTV